MMKSKDFVAQALAITDLRTLYVLGGYGMPLYPANKARAIKSYPYNAKRASLIQAASADTFGFDCCGLVKSILWGFCARTDLRDGGAQYGSNGVPDTNEAGFLQRCTKTSTDFRNVPVGACLFMPGHMGIYAGDGKAVEATPIWEDGVQVTEVLNQNPDAKGQGRRWSQWGLLPYVDYTEEEDMTREETIALFHELAPGSFDANMARYEKEKAQAAPSKWAEDAHVIERAKEEGIMVGDPDGNFRPQSYVKREELAAFGLNMKHMEE